MIQMKLEKRGVQQLTRFAQLKPSLDHTGPVVEGLQGHWWLNGRALGLTKCFLFSTNGNLLQQWCYYLDSIELNAYERDDAHDSWYKKVRLHKAVTKYFIFDEFQKFEERGGFFSKANSL